MTICIYCGEQYTMKRKQLGYNTCLNCGEKQAKKEINRKKKCVAPAYNKGAYQYVGSIEQAKYLGR